MIGLYTLKKWFINTFGTSVGSFLFGAVLITLIINIVIIAWLIFRLY